MSARWMVWASLALATGCADEEASPPALEPPLPGSAPEAPGPYAIGVTTIAAKSEGRSLPIEVWYPARGDGAPARYAITVGDITLVEIDSPLGAVRDAPLDLRGAPHTVVVFSHGFRGVRVQSVYLTEHLASHGFVVAAPDHVGNTFGDASATAADSARVRPMDVSRTLDALLAATDAWPESLLAFSADAARVGVAGHSFGGFTALRVAGATIDVARGDALCAADPGQTLCAGWPTSAPFPASALDSRFRAALPQAPGGAAAIDAGFAAIDVPVMLQAGTDDQTTPFASEAEAPFARLGDGAQLLVLEGAGHFTFSDMCMLMDVLGLELEAFDDGCAATNLAYAEAHPIIDRYAAAFFKVHVAGDESFPYADTLAAPAAPPATLTTR
jgi:predicted dienelactone hydrolase